MNINELHKKIQAVDAPPFLFTRIQQKLKRPIQRFCQRNLHSHSAFPLFLLLFLMLERLYIKQNKTTVLQVLPSQ
jgi:hypothetical protein